MLAVTALIAWAAYASRTTCSLEITNGKNFSLSMFVDPTPFGPHLSLKTRITAPVSLRLLVDGCLPGDSIRDVQGSWAVVHMDMEDVQCDSGIVPFRALPISNVLLTLQGAGATGVLFIEARASMARRYIGENGAGVSIPSMWGTSSDAALLLSRNDFNKLQAYPTCNAPELPPDGNALRYVAASHRTLYFTYTRSFSDAPESFAIVATPEFGAPRILVSHSVGNDTSLIALPRPGGMLVAESKEGVQPVVRLSVAAPGLYLMALICGESASNGTVRVERNWHNVDGITPPPVLLDGEPYIFTIAANGWQKLYLETNVSLHSVQLHTVVLAGRGRMYVCNHDPHEVTPDHETQPMMQPRPPPSVEQMAGLAHIDATEAHAQERADRTRTSKYARALV